VLTLSPSFDILLEMMGDDMQKELPHGCFEFVDHKRILQGDIKKDRPYDQCNISTERAINHSMIVKRKTDGIFGMGTAYWSVFSTTTYEMAGDYEGNYFRPWCWAETDLTGLEWQFNNEEDANRFLQENI
jgi:hypothetical protein